MSNQEAGKNHSKGRVQTIQYPWLKSDEAEASISISSAATPSSKPNVQPATTFSTLGDASEQASKIYEAHNEKQISHDDKLPDAQALYKDQRYGEALNACRTIWQAAPAQREGIRFIYAWSIYRHVLKTKHPKRDQVAKAVGAIAQLCPETQGKDPLPLAILTAADFFLNLYPKRGEQAFDLLRRLSLAQWDDEPNEFKGKVYPSHRERYVMLYSKALQEIGSWADCTTYITELIDDKFAFTGANESHLRYRRALARYNCEQDCSLALQELIDLEPSLPQFYVLLLQGDCYIKLGRHGEALGAYSGALFIAHDYAFAKHGLQQIVEHAEAFNVPHDLAVAHALLDHAVCMEKEWALRDYGDLLAEHMFDSPKTKQLVRQLKPHWKEWQAQRFAESTGAMLQWLPGNKAGFVSEDGKKKNLFVQSKSCRQPGLKPGTPVRFRLRRSYDRKRNRLGWEAVHVQQL